MKRVLASIAICAAFSLHSTIAHAGGAIDTVATKAAASLGPTTQSMLVVSAPLVTDQPMLKPDDLALRVAWVLAGKINAASHALPKVASLSVARAAAGRAAGLVYVSTRLEKGQLRVTADVFPVVANGWDRAREPAPSPRAHAYAEERIDAEVRTFSPPLSLEQAQIHKAHHDETGVIAAACGDLDGDGGLEIALISRGNVAVGQLRGTGDQEKFVVAKKVALAARSARVPTPLREPLAGAAFGEGRLLVGTSDREGVELGADLELRTTFTGIPAATSTGTSKLECARLDPASGALSGELRPCASSSSGAVIAAPLPRFDTLAFSDVVDKGGTSRSALAARDLDGKLFVKYGTATRTFDDVGAQSVVADLDLDGVPEIVTTRNATTDDAIQIWSYDGAQTRDRRKIPAPAGVSALAVCPPEASGAPALVAVVGPEIWIVR
ncbi:MAG TPA: hypothetical protein VF407_13170 [Polyangiaceae bacterium]